jgi:hypothetical protein
MVIEIMLVILIILTIGNMLCYFKNIYKEIMPTYAAIICLINIIYAIIIAIIVIIYGVTSPTKEENNLSSNSNDYSTEQTFYYQMTATAINENTFITEDGNMWRMKNINIEKGKKYQLTFDNHDTEIITDDEIVDFIELNEKVD